ncbi:hypothetical protein NR798_24125 [Archangium gephyra]|uniref:hypothetical protein n=1 Tax=Archangium gephyra TaxID=48 RepID=UPI0035D48EFF
MSPEILGALTVAASAIASGVTSAMANTRAVRRQVRKLRRTVSNQARAMKRLEQGQVETRGRVEGLESFQRQAERRISWVMGGVHALLGALRVKHSPANGVALDAEATGVAVARKAG